MEGLRILRLHGYQACVHRVVPRNLADGGRTTACIGVLLLVRSLGFLAELFLEEFLFYLLLSVFVRGLGLVLIVLLLVPVIPIQERVRF